MLLTIQKLRYTNNAMAILKLGKIFKNVVYFLSVASDLVKQRVVGTESKLSKNNEFNKVRHCYSSNFHLQ